jgi:hypothetical protein
MNEEQVVSCWDAMLDAKNASAKRRRMQLRCGHEDAYRCSKCKRCNQCEHRYVYLTGSDNFQKKCGTGRMTLATKPDYTFANRVEDTEDASVGF